jgi:pyridinium-3,5-biscarboxylic acid mononucleotide sulfurtransferase
MYIVKDHLNQIFMTKETEEKLEKLQDYIKNLGSLAIAFSGGTDSSFLLYLTHSILGNKSIGLTVKSPYIAQWEIDEALEFVKNYNIPHKIIEVPFDEQIRNNPSNRCYLCKLKVFNILKKEAQAAGFQYLADGTNHDDLSDFRPGLRALKEMNIKSPLLECSLSKNEVREISKFLNIPTWDKPAYACLLTRLPVDTEIKLDSLRRIEKAEKFIIDQGIRAVRVREHGNIARIETTENNLSLITNPENRNNIVKALKEFGYTYVCIDLEGYRTGSMN